MAITWDLKVTPINISTYEASIVATRTETNETDPQNPVIVSVDTYNVHRAKIQTSAQQFAVGQEIRAKHLAACHLLYGQLKYGTRLLCRL